MLWTSRMLALQLVVNVIYCNIIVQAKNIFKIIIVKIIYNYIFVHLHKEPNFIPKICQSDPRPWDASMSRLRIACIKYTVGWI